MASGGSAERKHVSPPWRSTAVNSIAHLDSCASALYYYDSENISESLLAFRSEVDGDDGELSYHQDDYKAIEKVFGLEKDEPLLRELGQVVTKQGRLVTFPNVMQHRVCPFRLEDPTKPGHRKILALFLIDPGKPIISTANIPPQQQDWWWEQVCDIGPLGELPEELKQRILDFVDDSITLGKAKEQRLELMEERKFFVHQQNDEMNKSRFSLCEH